MNDNDVVTAAPPRRLSLFYHWGKCLFAPEYFAGNTTTTQPAREFVVVCDPYTTHNNNALLHVRDFGVDRLRSTGVFYELVECLRDGFAAHKLTPEKGYAGQFQRAPTAIVPQRLRELYLLCEEDANGNGIPDSAEPGGCAAALHGKPQGDVRVNRTVVLRSVVSDVWKRVWAIVKPVVLPVLLALCVPAVWRVLTDNARSEGLSSARGDL